MVIWKSVPVDISIKMVHIRKMFGRTYTGFCHDYGDVPAARINSETNVIEEVVNPRGIAYAYRNRKQFRNKKAYSRK